MENLREVCRTCTKQVVNISTITEIEEKDNPMETFFFPRKRKPREMRAIGSGVIVSKDGIVVTNDHVVGNSPDTINISIPTQPKDKVFEAEVIARDSIRDLALLKILNPPKNLHVAELGDSTQCEVGDRVLAIGNNLGFKGTVTDGIISAIGRSTDPRLPFRAPLIQTNANINPGSSGGALFNFKGKLIGINESIITNTGTNIGIGFAIPVNFLLPLIWSVGKETSNEPVRVWDGITVDLAEEGVKIVDIHEESPAFKSGLRKDDVLLSIDGTILTSVEKHTLLVVSTKPDSSREYVYKRKNSTKKMVVKLEPLPSPIEPLGIFDDKRNPFNGAVLVQLCPATNLDFGFGLSETGVAVYEIETGTLAAALRIQPRDIILKVNRKEIKKLEDIENLTIPRLSTSQRQMKIVLKRGNKKLTREFVIRPRWRRQRGAKL